MWNQLSTFLISCCGSCLSRSLCPCPNDVKLCSARHTYKNHCTEPGVSVCVCVRARSGDAIREFIIIITVGVELTVESHASSCSPLVSLSSYRTVLLSTFVDLDHVTKPSHIYRKCAYGTCCTVRVSTQSMTRFNTPNCCSMWFRIE